MDLAPVIVNGLRCDIPSQAILIAACDLHELDLACLLEGAQHRGILPEREEDGLPTEAFPGSPRLRRPFDLATGGAESIWEVLLRVLHGAGDVAVEAQFEVSDDHGVFLGRADLRIVGTRRLPEFDGGGHRDAAQHRKDLKRDRRLAGCRPLRSGNGTSSDRGRRPERLL